MAQAVFLEVFFAVEPFLTSSTSWSDFSEANLEREVELEGRAYVAHGYGRRGWSPTVEDGLGSNGDVVT